MRQPLSPRLDFSDEQWEDICHECGGWEWIDGEKEGGERNEFKGAYVGSVLLYMKFPRLLYTTCIHRISSFSEGK